MLFFLTPIAMTNAAFAYDQSLFLENTGATGAQNDLFQTKAAAAGSNALFDITPTTAFSVSFWAKFDTAVTGGIILWSKVQSGFVGYQFYYESSPGFFRTVIGQSGFIDTRATFTVATGTWYHIVLTKSTSAGATGTKIYINGVDETSSQVGTAVGTLTAAAPLTFAGISIANAGYNWPPFDGYMQNASYWSKELSSAEVSSLYNSGVPTDLTGSANLEGWWKMGNTTGDDATAANGIKDSSGNNRHLSTRNTPSFATEGP